MRRLLLLLLLALPVFGRSIEWTSIDVKARLDRDGNLHVVERQAIVFDGDWNGGERAFNLRGRQRLDLHRIARIEDGREIALAEGDLDAIDEYQFISRDVVRWRSRLPSDPPFAVREIAYLLDFTYGNVLEADGEQFVLWHDFGLPDRAGAIGRFTLNLEFDPAWKTAPVSETIANLAPGQGFAVRRPLVHAGGMKPKVYRGGLVFVGGFIAGVALLIILFIRAERGTGRFAGVEADLDTSLLELRAEVVGAVWDASVGAPEVAATLARMTAEKKITTRVDGKTLHMHLEVPRHELSGYERTLVGKLFFDGDDTDTERIRRHYKSTGADFAAELRPGIETALKNAVPGWNTKRKRFARRPHIFSLIAVAAILVALAVLGPHEDLGEILVILCLGAFFGLLACAVAHHNARTITGFIRAFLPTALLLTLPSLLLIFAAVRGYPAGRVSMVALIASALWLLSILRLALDLLKTPEETEVTVIRKRAVATRKYFVQQLRLPSPALRDEWFAFLLAFGLGKHADRWFRAFGGASSSVGSIATHGSSGSSGSSSSPSWTGGGGGFGGAGATASWAVAATAIGNGVSQPSSGGSSGGGSSSGGGGGGGW